MRRTVAISLDEKTCKKLDAIARREGVSRSDLIRESLRDFLFVRNFRRLRSRLMAKAQGIYKDQDVFDRVSNPAGGPCLVGRGCEQGSAPCAGQAKLEF